MAGNLPKYREAYHRLDIRELQAATLAGRIACQFTDEIGRDLGQAFILNQADDAIYLGFALHAPYLDYKAGQISLQIEHAPDPVNPELYFFRCPDCDLPRKILFFKGRWSCGDCHGLVHRSNLMRGDIREYERNLARRDGLRIELRKGRPHRMRHTTFERLEAEYIWLGQWLETHPRKVASAHHRHLVTGTWMEPEKLPNGLAHGGYYVFGNGIEKHSRFRPMPGHPGG